MESAESVLTGESLKEAPVEALMHSDAPKTNVFGEQQLNPRVGGKYQVEIPFMTEEMMESERIKLLTNPAESELVGDSLSFLMGLPVPIAWVKEGYNVEAEGLDSPKIPDDASILKRYLEARKRLKMHKRPRKKSSELNMNSLASRLSHGDDSRPTSLKMLLLEKRQSYQPLKSERYCLVPDSFRRPWSDDEADSFLLGLYIFGKNFNQVKKFMDHKSTGEIMSFYYGIFYRSHEYFRWWDCQKSRKRKCIIGDKIFRGWRQRELSSRIIPHVREESRITLYEGYRSFAEGRTSLDDYVSFLKSIVANIHVLVEAVGIGKGEKDLTGFPLEPGKNNQENSIDPSPRIPNGKAFASLTFTEIVNLLTGGTRLSKARRIDIFWEAVWPRLLANGWHSEQPKDRGYVSSKNYLVFLMPGIKKYSKRKLTKGDHYLDSVSDVLHKVTSEPKLIQLEAEKNGVANEGESTPEVTSDQEDEACFQRPCYLKPRVPKISNDNTKFAIIDSSSPSMSDDKQPKGSSSTSYHSDSSSPRIKRRKLTSCVKAETSSLNENCSRGLESMQVEQVGLKSLNGTLADLNPGTLVVDLVGPKQEPSSSCTEAEDSLEDESSLESRGGDYSGMQTSQTYTSSDVSQPQDFLNRTVGDTNETNADNSGLLFNQIKPLDDPSGTVNMNSRRQSSRTRPLTTKAMECLANGYLSIKTRQKKVVCRRDNSLSRRPSRKSHRPRSIEEASSSPPPESVNETAASKEEMKVNETCNANEDAVMKPFNQMADKWLTGY